jgi:hypothetical protein
MRPMAAAVAGTVICSVLVLSYVLPHPQQPDVLSASFDAGAIYKVDKKIDLDHPNRIDKYGCLFAGCSGSGGGSLSRKGALASAFKTGQADTS